MKSASVLVPLGFGVLLSLAFDPVAWQYVGPLALAGLSLTIARLSLLNAALRAWVFGAGYMLAVLAWMQPSVGPGPWVGLSLLLSLWFAPLGWAIRAVRDLRGSPLWSAALWTTFEGLRGAWPFGGLPWGRLGVTLVDTPWAPLLPVFGITGGGFVVAWAGFALAATLAVRPQLLWKRRAAGLMTGVFAFTFLPQWAAQSVETGEFSTVAVVQGGVPGDGTDLVKHHRRVTRNLVDATRQVASMVAAGNIPEPDLVVWPENSTAVDPFDDPQASQAIQEAVASIAQPILVGAMVDARDPAHVLNQGIVWDAVKGPGERYTKRHPVPFGEYIPLRAALSGLNSGFADIPRDMLAGVPSDPLPVGDVNVAMAICFDVAFDDVIAPQVRRGADMVVVQTSNAMFTGTAQRSQQFAITRARALETGRSVVVASSNGISGAIDPKGNVIAQSATDGTEILVSRVPLRTSQTPAMRVAVPLADLLAVLAAGSVVLALVSGRSVRRAQPVQRVTRRRL